MIIYFLHEHIDTLIFGTKLSPYILPFTCKLVPGTFRWVLCGLWASQSKTTLFVRGVILVCRPNCWDATGVFGKRPIFRMFRFSAKIAQPPFTTDAEGPYWRMPWIETQPGRFWWGFLYYVNLISVAPQKWEAKGLEFSPSVVPPAILGCSLDQW